MIVTVRYHSDPEAVWAEGVDVDGLTIAASTLDEARALVRDSLPFYFDGDVDLREELPSGAPVVVAELSTSWGWDADVHELKGASEGTQQVSSYFVPGTAVC